MTLFLKFLAALPTLFKLFEVIDKRIKDAKLDRKVVDDVKIIHEAFDAKDPAKLNSLFASD